jgi:hypothetical protein
VRERGVPQAPRLLRKAAALRRGWQGMWQGGGQQRMPSGTAAAVAEVVEALCQLFISALSRPHKAYHVQWGRLAMASCSNVCGRVHRYPMPSRAWSGGTWSCLRQPSTERPLCRPFETTKADMVALSACGINELHSWWRSLFDDAERPHVAVC